MDAAVEFYRLLGLDINAVPGTWPPGSGGRHAAASSTDIARVELDNTELARIWGQAPYEAFLGASDPIVDDPDGHSIGLMSPIDAALEFTPAAGEAQ